MTPRTPARGDAGFSLPELMISMGIMLVVLAGTFRAMTIAMKAEQTASNITTLNGNLRASMDLLVRDLLQVGQGMPVGRVIGIPNGPGATAITRPGPAAEGACAGVTPFPITPTLSAVTVGPNLGPAINGQCTDVITTIAHDGIFDNINVTSIALNGRSLTILPYGPDGAPGGGDDIDMTDAPDALGDNIRPGDFMEVTKGSASVLVVVSAVAGDTITFDPGDTLGINQFDTGLAMLGTMNQLRAQAPVDGAAPVVNAGVIQPSQGTAVSRLRMISYWVNTTLDPTSPRLMRQINAAAPNAVAFELEAFRIGYDLADGVTNPTDVRMVAADLAPGGACGASACSPNQIRKANVVLAIRSAKRTAESGYNHNTLFTQVAMRNLSFVDRYP
jgi:prepilin-type N-terminal cleavage/methylation domain-containing protein